MVDIDKFEIYKNLRKILNLYFLIFINIYIYINKGIFDFFLLI